MKLKIEENGFYDFKQVSYIYIYTSIKVMQQQTYIVAQ